VTGDFYGLVEKELTARDMPGLGIPAWNSVRAGCFPSNATIYASCERDWCSTSAPRLLAPGISSPSVSSNFRPVSIFGTCSHLGFARARDMPCGQKSLERLWAFRFFRYFSAAASELWAIPRFLMCFVAGYVSWARQTVDQENTRPSTVDWRLEKCREGCGTGRLFPRSAAEARGSWTAGRWFLPLSRAGVSECPAEDLAARGA